MSRILLVIFILFFALTTFSQKDIPDLRKAIPCWNLSMKCLNGDQNACIEYDRCGCKNIFPQSSSTPLKSHSSSRIFDGAGVHYIDFSSYPNRAVEKSMTFSAFGADNNPYYKGSLRLKLPQQSYIKTIFTDKSLPEKVTLTIAHLSSFSAQCQNNGWSPVTITMNNKVIVTNFSPLTHDSHACPIPRKMTE